MKLKLQLALFLFFQCFSTTSAAQINATFSGIVTSTSANSVTITEVQVDDQVTGTFSFDSHASDEMPGAANSGLYSAETFNLSVSGFSFSAEDSIVAESEEDFYLVALRLESTEGGFQLTSVPARSSALP